MIFVEIGVALLAIAAVIAVGRWAMRDTFTQWWDES